MIEFQTWNVQTSSILNITSNFSFIIKDHPSCSVIFFIKKIKRYSNLGSQMPSDFWSQAFFILYIWLIFSWWLVLDRFQVISRLDSN
jgi:hypothetical protein